MARFFIPGKKIQQKRGTVDGPELEHLRRVLRLAPGDHITVFDDTGWEHEAVIRSFSAGQGEIEILRSYQAERESPLNVTLALGLTKGAKMDFVIEKATELGVQTIVPFVSTYTVPKFDAGKIESRTQRWQKIALSAAKQCGRTRVPKIFALTPFPELIRQSWPSALKLLLWEMEAQRTLTRVHEKHSEVRSLALIIGPEGGFSPEEAAEAMNFGFEPIRLGKRTLRAETAALAVLSVVQYLWGDMR